MTSPPQTLSQADIGDPSVDDLLAPLPEVAPRLGGPGPFVINLSASSAPIAPQAVNIAGCEQAHAYQIQRTEDRRIRFRLRFGPFATEDEVDSILEQVRALYPSALPATADADDLRMIAALQSRALAHKSPARRLAAAPRAAVAATVAAAPRIAAAPPAAAAAAPVAAVPPMTAARSNAPLATAKQAPAIPAPATQASGRAIAASPESTARRLPGAAAASPDFVLTLAEWPGRAPAAAPEPAARPAAPRSPSADAASPDLVLTLSEDPPRAPTAASGPAARRSPSADAAQADLVLTLSESSEELAMGWFVIQLMSSENTLDVDGVPKHDIFKAYRLYSVAALDQGRVLHSLRLGFFKEETAAQAVASYLAAFYEKPTIKRVTAAERKRFADRRVDPRREAGPGAPATIEITNDRFVRPKSGQGTVSGKTR